ncbi:hypothetical protein [Scytonema sp. HK-05]|uniref:hypothetical protein n=1 Tax=Scytonema sp. HK-05 TaxID=1137095 RepID=UPI00095FC914|nr:hypothetical protein [Scytonema sp. HK-05]OKH45582.1 hypothetical protein NIES2130_37045 [Scytonema sp. HK-05]
MAAKAANANEIFQIADEEVEWNASPNEIRDYMIQYAFINNRWDILVTFELGVNPPPDRKQYWLKKYQEQLGKPDIDYWGEWSRNQEAHQVCQELTNLLQLSRPLPDVKLILQSLAYLNFLGYF